MSRTTVFHNLRCYPETCHFAPLYFGVSKYYKIRTHSKFNKLIFQLKKELSDALLAAEHERDNFKNEVGIAKIPLLCAGHVLLPRVLIGSMCCLRLLWLLCFVLYELHLSVTSYPYYYSFEVCFLSINYLLIRLLLTSLMKSKPWTKLLCSFL